MFWYHVNGYAFGFAAEAAISLSDTDGSDTDSDRRLSWALDNSCDYDRAGAVTTGSYSWVGCDSDWRRRVMVGNALS